MHLRLTPTSEYRCMPTISVSRPLIECSLGTHCATDSNEPSVIVPCILVLALYKWALRCWFLLMLSGAKKRKRQRKPLSEFAGSCVCRSLEVSRVRGQGINHKLERRQKIIFARDFWLACYGSKFRVALRHPRYFRPPNRKSIIRTNPVNSPPI